jgi:hypothetical protein
MRQHVIKLTVGLTFLGLVSLVLLSWHIGEGGVEGESTQVVAKSVEEKTQDVVTQQVEAIEKKEKALKVNFKQVELKLAKLDRKRREIEAQSVELENNSALADQFAQLQASLDALPDGSKLLDPDGGRVSPSSITGRARLQTPGWQAAMDNYERETGISRAEAEAILQVQ